MTDVKLQELRLAFAEVLGAERRLRSRDPRRPGELSHAQVSALIQMSKGEELTAGELAKRAELSPGAMTAMLDQLETEGTITRRRSETDRRQVIVALTEHGHSEVAAKRSTWEGAWRDALAELPDEDLEAATRVLRAMAKLLDELGPES